MKELNTTLVVTHNEFNLETVVLPFPRSEKLKDKISRITFWEHNRGWKVNFLRVSVNGSWDEPYSWMALSKCGKFHRGNHYEPSCVRLIQLSLWPSYHRYRTDNSFFPSEIDEKVKQSICAGKVIYIQWIYCRVGASFRNTITLGFDWSRYPKILLS